MAAFKPGDRVVRNPSQWTPTELDWGRGELVATEPPMDVRWEKEDQLLPVDTADKQGAQP